MAQVNLAKLALLLYIIGAARANDRQPHDVDLNNPIDDLLRKALETLRANMSQGFPQWGVPPLDPWIIGNVPLDVSGTGVSMKGNLSNLNITELSTFSIDSIHTNILTLKIDVALSVPTVALAGGYAIDGLIADLFPLYGGGPLSTQITNVPLQVTADMGRNGSSYIVQTLDFDLSIETLDIQLHNLFNSEDIATVVDGFVDDFGPELIDILVNDTRRDLIPKIIDIINGLLSEVEEKPTLLEEEEEEMLDGPLSLWKLGAEASANEYFDRTLVNFRKLILDNALDPFALPEVKIEVVGTGIDLREGHLDGLSNVHRTGDAQMTYDGEWLGIEGHIGFNGLGAGYTCRFEILHIGHDVSATASITETSIHFAAKISSKTLKIELESFDIENVGNIVVDISGLGPFDWLLEPLAEAIANVLKGAVVDLINVVVKPILAKFIESIDIIDILNHLL